MARSSKLKVFRTPIGFHDAYVAAPSQKAALTAWGADSNLFASGSAELVEDPELMKEPLAHPGQVIRRLRGTLAEHVAALPKVAAATPPTEPRPNDTAAARPTRAKKPKPRPSRAALDKAETALAVLETRHAAEKAELARQQAVLDKARRALEARQSRDRDKQVAKVDAASETYESAMRTWRAS